MIEIIPDELMFPNMIDEVIAFLKALAAAPRTKKEALIAWCKAMDVQFTRAMFVELLGVDIDMT